MRMRLFALVFLVVTPLFSMSAFSEVDVAASGTDREMLGFRYAEFLGAFRGRNWSHVCEFVTDETEAGFGPGQLGCAGVKEVFAKNDPCWEDMLFALRQGCRIGSNATTCSAPPQLSENVAYLGARAVFSYDKENDLLRADALICGGD